MYYINKYLSPFGQLLLCSNGEALIGVWWENQRCLDLQMINNCQTKVLPIFDKTCCWLDNYFQCKKNIQLPQMQLIGSEFRKMVWQILQTIPYGSLTTYGEIAIQIAKIKNVPKISAQAVGGAIANNPINILIPCHRVIGSNGKLIGYGGGLERKSQLLYMEKHTISQY